MTSVRRVAAMVATTGVIAGAAAAALIPNAPSVPEVPDFKAPAGPLTIAPARTRERGPTGPASVYMRAHPGTVRLEARRPDPSGGPDWVLRVYEADRMIPEASRRPGSDGVISVGLCAQLGREVGGRFGWIDGTNTFRPVSTAAYTGSPSTCGSRKLDTRKLPELDVSTLVDRPRSLDPALRGSVVWGLVGRQVNGATLKTAGQRSAAEQSGAHGAFIRFVGPSKRAVDASLTVEYPGGTRVTRSTGRGTPLPGALASREDDIVPGSSRVIARTFDPGGGPSWGARATRTRSGGWCLGPAGHLVGDRVGEIEEPLGLLIESPETAFPNGCRAGSDPDRLTPLQFVASGGSYVDVPQLDPGRGVLRLEPGRSFIWGRAAEHVALVTIATPRDVRTIEPSGPAGGFIVVYDGKAFGGDVKLTAHFDDGREQTFTSPAMY